MKKNNKGFTLVEIIIVMAIMGVVTVGFIANVSLSRKQKTTAIAKDIGAQMSKTRSKCMGKKDKYYVYIYKSVTDNCFYMKESTDDNDSLTEKGEKLGPNYYQISYREGTTENYVDGVNKLVFTFSKSNGSMLKKDGTEAKYFAITVFGPGREEVITIAPKTGKYSRD